MPSTQALLGNRPDTPSSMYRLLSWGWVMAISTSLVALGAAAWIITIREAGSMSDMVMGLGQVDRRMPNEMGVGAFLQMWTVMMTAMMAPALVPAVLAHRLVLRRRQEGVVSSAAFVAGFLAVWSLVGVVYVLPFLWFRGLAADVADEWWLPILAGATLILAGAYQFSRRKAHCQQACCAPVALVLDHDAGRGATNSLRTGLEQGVHCLGCCWALMAVLLVVGLMNLAWMIGLSLVFLVEKHWRQALVLSRMVGVAFIVLGFGVMAWPGLLHPLSGPSAKTPATTMDMR